MSLVFTFSYRRCHPPYILSGNIESLR